MISCSFDVIFHRDDLYVFNFLLWSILAKALINAPLIKTKIFSKDYTEKLVLESTIEDKCKPSCFPANCGHLFCSPKHKKAYLIDTNLRSKDKARDICQSWSKTSRLINVDNIEEYVTFLTLLYE